MSAALPKHERPEVKRLVQDLYYQVTRFRSNSLSNSDKEHVVRLLLAQPMELILKFFPGGLDEVRGYLSPERTKR